MSRHPASCSDIEGLVVRLEGVYGRARFISRFDPIEELVSCILSQNTADANSFPAFTRLRETFADWAAVVDAGPERLAEVIRKAGLSNQKSKAIIGSLVLIHERFGDYTLEPLRQMPPRQARDWLVSLPGVGLKTASIVLCFAFGRDAIPVDTHVHRVSQRLGLIPPKADANKAHDLLLEVVPSGLAFRFHTALIQHGRKTCKAPIPLCETCVVRDDCRWYRDIGPEKAKAAMRRARRT